MNKQRVLIVGYGEMGHAMQHLLFEDISAKVTFFGDRLTGDYRPKDLHRMRIGIRRVIGMFF